MDGTFISDMEEDGRGTSVVIRNFEFKVFVGNSVYSENKGVKCEGICLNHFHLN